MKRKQYKAPGGRFIKPDEFDSIRLMKKAGLSDKQVSQITLRSQSVINQIGKYEVFEDYQAAMRQRIKESEARSAARKVQPVVEPPRISPPAVAEDEMTFLQILQNNNDFIMEVNVQLSDIQSRLKSMAEKLAWIEEHAVVDTSRFKRWTGRD